MSLDTHTFNCTCLCVARLWQTSLFNTKPVHHRVTFNFSPQQSLLLHLSLPISPEQFWHTHCSEPLRALFSSPVSPIMHRCRLLLHKTPLNFLSCIGSAVSLVGAVNWHIRNWLCFYATALITPGAKWAVHAQCRAVNFGLGFFFFFSPLLNW